MLSTRLDTDIVIAGGGIAGLVAAIALGRQGFCIVLIEPCIHSQQRIGGEILQPMGAVTLSKLGLLENLHSYYPATLAGFHIWDDEAGDVTLRYPKPQFGLAVEHENLRCLLLAAVIKEPNVHIEIGRLSSYIEHKDCIEVRSTDKTKSVTYRAALLVGADGSRSRIRALANIACKHSAVSKLNILSIPDALLPDTEMGHLFVGHGTIAFTYSLGGGKARLLVDHHHDVPRSVHEMAMLLPEDGASHFKQRLNGLPNDQPVHHYVTSLAVVNKPYKQRVVLIGDAAGTCHPVTASGMASAILDALELTQALFDHWDNMPHALAAYARHCRWRHSSRLVLANAMYEIYTGSAPECLPLRRAMLFDFGHSESSYASSLLAMTRNRPSLVMHAMTRTFFHSLKDVCVNAVPESTYTLRTSRLRMSIGTSSRMLRYGAALFGAPWRFQ